MDKLMEFAKQLQAFIAAVLPLFSAEVNEILPFLNPQIASDMATVSGLLAIISLVVYNLSKPAQSPATARFLMLFGIVVTIGALLLILMISDRILFSTNPDLQDLTVRGLFVLFFAGIAAPLGWVPVDRPVPAARAGARESCADFRVGVWDFNPKLE